MQAALGQWQLFDIIGYKHKQLAVSMFKMSALREDHVHVQSCGFF